MSCQKGRKGMGTKADDASSKKAHHHYVSGQLKNTKRIHEDEGGSPPNKAGKKEGM